jgi:hypothetical protein
MGFELPPSKPWGAEPWPYAANPPQRYTDKRDRYIAQGGLVRLEDDVKGFVEGGRHVGDMARFYFFSLVLDQLQKEAIPGDIAELGVYKGDTATLLAGMARKLGKRAFFLDTFEGFSAEDLRGFDAGVPMEFADTSLETVRARIGDDSVQFVQGFFPGTASQLPQDGQYCLVHIDCDLFAPMMSALEYFYPLMAPGGYIVMHDYSSLFWNGAEKAVDEFFVDKPESIIGLPDASGSAVMRKAKVVDASDNWLARRRASVVNGGWIDAATSQFGDLIVSGWSGQEEWGVWGVGEAHVLEFLRPPGTSDRTFVFEAECSALVLGVQTEQTVDVIYQDQVIGRWVFNQAENLGVRSVRIEPPVGDPDQGRTLVLTFRPHHVVKATDLTADTQDDRELGLAVKRARLTMAD